MGKYGDTSKTRHSTLKTSWFFFNADIYRILFSPLNYTQATHCRTAYMYVSVRSVSVWFCPSFNLLSIFCRRPLLLPSLLLLLMLLLLLLRLYFALLDDIHTVFEILLSLHNLVLIQILWPYFVGNFDTHTHKYASIESIGMIFSCASSCRFCERFNSFKRFLSYLFIKLIRIGNYQTWFITGIVYIITVVRIQTVFWQTSDLSITNSDYYSIRVTRALHLLTHRAHNSTIMKQLKSTQNGSLSQIRTK